MTKITEGERVKTGRKGTEAYDEGTVLLTDPAEVADHPAAKSTNDTTGMVIVGWDQGITTAVRAADLRRL